MAEKKMNIYQRLSNVTTELGHVAKNLNVGWGDNSYKAVSEVDVLNAVKPLEDKHGVYSFPLERTIVDHGVITSIDSKRKEKKQFYLRVETKYRFVNVDNPSEYIDITSYGDGLDSGDKATGKAMTYADKYALLKAYKISTGDDPDKDASQDLKSVKTNRQTKQQPTQQSNNIDITELTNRQTKQQPTQQSNNIDITELTTTYQSLLMKAEKDGIDTHGEKFLNYMKKNAQIDSTDIGNLIVDPFALQRAIETLKTMPTPGGKQ